MKPTIFSFIVVLALLAHACAVRGAEEKEGRVVFERQKLVSPTLPSQFANVLATDGKTLLVGTAVGYDDFGRVMVYEKAAEDNTWVYGTTLAVPDHVEPKNEFFGQMAIAVQDDTIAIGAPIVYDDDCEHCGSIYIYQRNDEDGNWAFAQRLQVSSKGSPFGYSLALQDDTLVAGDFLGRIFVYSKQSTNGQADWQVTQTLEEEGWWIASCVISGNTLVVGGTAAPSDNNDSPPDAAIVFQRQENSGEWEETQRLRLSDPDIGPMRLVLDASVLVISSRTRTNDAGFIFEPIEDENGLVLWKEQQRLAPSGLTDAFVGVNVAQGRIFLPHWKDDGTPAVEVLEKRDGEGWTATALFVPSDHLEPNAVALFGQTSAAFGSTIFIGAPSRDVTDDTIFGSVYVFCCDEIIVSA